MVCCVAGCATSCQQQVSKVFLPSFSTKKKKTPRASDSLRRQRRRTFFSLFWFPWGKGRRSDGDNGGLAGTDDDLSVFFFLLPSWLSYCVLHFPLYLSVAGEEIKYPRVHIFLFSPYFITLPSSSSSHLPIFSFEGF